MNENLVSHECNYRIQMCENKITNLVYNEKYDLEHNMQNKIGELNSQINNMYSIINDLKNELSKTKNKEELIMLEGKDLIRHIFNERKSVVNNYYDELINKATDEDEVIKKYEQLKENLLNAVDSVYNEYAKREIEENKENPFVKTGCSILGIQLMGGYIPEKVSELMKERDAIISSLDKQSSLIMSATGIAQNKEEIEEILSRYDLLDKNGKAITSYDFNKKNKKDK